MMLYLFASDVKLCDIELSASNEVQHVIPAQAGIHTGHPGKAFVDHRLADEWIPAFAGMTEGRPIRYDCRAADSPG